MDLEQLNNARNAVMTVGDETPPEEIRSIIDKSNKYDKAIDALKFALEFNDLNQYKKDRNYPKNWWPTNTEMAMDYIEKTLKELGEI